MVSATEKMSTVPTVWGLTPTQLHDRFWAARGVQVVRQGEKSEIVANAELFLLTAPRSLVIFKLGLVVEKMVWERPDVMFVRLHDEREQGYREQVVTDTAGQFVRFERSYGGSASRLARVLMTKDVAIAQAWQGADDLKTAWRRLRDTASRGYRSILSLRARLYDRANDEDQAAFVRNLVNVWSRPDATVKRARRLREDEGAWTDQESQVADACHFIGPVWVGANRHINEPTVVGPAVLWDEPEHRPRVDALVWDEIEPVANFNRTVQPRKVSSLGRFEKRLFDIVFASIALLLTLPIYPLVMLAIWLEDGRPFFFAHARETIGGKEFPCIKFRSMRKDAEAIKKELAKKNQADGPQFFIEDDPRLTRVGWLIRKMNIDELPQFINVLLGHMSVVGPRPSPRKENQYCPPWREARLSVRPGITGLWQVRRTRVPGLDFQEWIKYDIVYVENANWKLDLSIIWQTMVTIIRGAIRS
ncbi:MAG TPA: sugar transferase [Tepidisphaeraceae bacterium]